MRKPKLPPPDSALTRESVLRSREAGVCQAGVPGRSLWAAGWCCLQSAQRAWATPSSPRPVLSSGAFQCLDPGAALPGGLGAAGRVGALGSLPEGHEAGPLAPGSRRGESRLQTCLSLLASLPSFCFFLPFFPHNSWARIMHQALLGHWGHSPDRRGCRPGDTLTDSHFYSLLQEGLSSLLVHPLNSFSVSFCDMVGR